MRFVAAMALWLMASSAFAVPVTYVFSGYIDTSDVRTPPDYPIATPDLGITVGMSFTGLLNYDPDALSCTSVSEDSRGCFSSDTTPFWMVSFGNIVLTSAGSHVLVRDNNLIFQQRGEFLPSTYDGWDLIAQSDTFLFLSDPSNSTYISDFVGAPSDLTPFIGSWVENAFIAPASGEAREFRWDVGGTITEFHRVPEPATAALFGVGLLLVVASRRRARRS